MRSSQTGDVFYSARGQVAVGRCCSVSLALRSKQRKPKTMLGGIQPWAVGAGAQGQGDGTGGTVEPKRTRLGHSGDHDFGCTPGCKDWGSTCLSSALVWHSFLQGVGLNRATTTLSLLSLSQGRRS